MSRPVAVLIAAVVLWFGACAVRGNLNPAPPDPWPGCAAACHGSEAAEAVDDAAEQAGPGFVCWAEDNAEMPGGFEVLCRSRT